MHAMTTSIIPSIPLYTRPYPLPLYDVVANPTITAAPTTQTAATSAVAQTNLSQLLNLVAEGAVNPLGSLIDATV
jgi:hypothetical protein